MQLDDEKFEPENKWAADKSVTGQLKLKYAFKFFPRSEGFFREIASATGFSVAAVWPMSELLAEPFDDIYHQHLIVLTKV